MCFKMIESVRIHNFLLESGSETVISFTNLFKDPLFHCTRVNLFHFNYIEQLQTELMVFFFIFVLPPPIF